MQFLPAMYDADELADMLMRCGWVDELDFDHVKQIARHGYAYESEANKVLCREGARESYVGVVLRGKVRVVKEDCQQCQKEIATFGAGRSFGEMSLVDGEPRSASIVACESTVVLVLTKQSFVALSKENPKLGVQILFKISKTISRRLRQTSGRLIDLL